MTQTGLIREARRLSGMTQQDAAELAGVSVVTYAKYEVDFGEFRMRQLHDVAEGMNEEGAAMLRKAIDSFFAEGIGV